MTMNIPPSKIVAEYNLQIFADYFQFMLEDAVWPEVTQQSFPPDDWGVRLTEEYIAAVPGIVGIATARNMTVPLTLAVYDAEPSQFSATWDRITTATLTIVSGQMRVKGPTDYPPDAVHILLPPNTYRVRVYYGGLDTISENGLDGADHYRIELW